MNAPVPTFDGVIADKRVRYALLAFGVQAKMVKPDDAAREILADLQTAGVDLRGGIARWRVALEKATGQHAAIIDALEALLPPEESAPARRTTHKAGTQRLDITVRDLGRR